jgi:hypothetical protein
LDQKEEKRHTAEIKRVTRAYVTRRRRRKKKKE